MNSESKIVVARFKSDNIISQLLSEQFEISYPRSSIAERSWWPSDLLSVSEVRSRYPDIIDAIEKRGITINVQDSVVKAFKLDTSFLRRPHIENNTNEGFVFILPREFMLAMPGLLNQKPDLKISRSIDQLQYSISYTWKVEQANNDSIYDLLASHWPMNVMSGNKNAFEESMFEPHEFWTDIIFLCGDIIGIGGFHYSAQDVESINIDTYHAENFNPYREFSEDELKEAAERKEAVSSSAPWFEQVCKNEEGRRYRQVKIVK